LGSRHYTPAVDVWALGALFGELILSAGMFRGAKEEADGIAKVRKIRVLIELQTIVI
jgi:hypothetical protein